MAAPQQCSIREFYQAKRVREALNAYSGFARSTAWRIDHKIELYEQAAMAFDSDVDDIAKRKAFREVYEALRRHWQVFRGSRTRWTSDEAFVTLQRCMVLCSRQSGTSLPAIAADANLKDVVETVYLVRGIKGVAAGRPVTMAISKFLHFFNPCVFPIYDSAIIENEVLDEFAQDWYGFDQRVCIPNLHFPTAYYVRYICWLGSLMAAEPDAVMAIFANWVRDEVARLNPVIQVPSAIEKYYATAAEVIAIGAWQALTR